MMDLNNITDVLVIGSGGAGLSAALEAKRNGSKVLVLSKTHPTHSQTCQAQGGINASTDNNETSIQSHIDDTYKGSHGLGNIENINLMCKESANTIKWLDEIGVPFSRNKENKVAQRKFGAASQIRTCYSSDYTGLKILHTLYDKSIKENIQFLNEFLLLNIIHKEGVVFGVTALNIRTTEIVEIFAKSIIIATGGYSNLYNNFTTNSKSTTGDGIAAALRAGCELSNMEMIQFHPTAMKDNNILISESARGEGGYLIDSNGERFVDELLSRDVVARAINDKIASGNNVFLDLRHIGKDKLLEFMPQEYSVAKDFLDIEIDKELLPVNPAAHYCMGGIKTNVSCETILKNLYACGEVSQSGIHGANRLGGNSLLEIITFGKIAGKNASKNSLKNNGQKLDNCEQLKNDKNRIEKIFSNSKDINFYKTKKELGKLFFNNVGLLRNEKEMKQAHNIVKELISISTTFSISDKSKTYNKNLMELLELENLLLLSEVVIISAMSRKESRGAHFRTDYPQESKDFEKNTIIKKENNLIKTYFEDIS